MTAAKKRAKKPKDHKAQAFQPSDLLDDSVYLTAAGQVLQVQRIAREAGRCTEVHYHVITNSGIGSLRIMQILPFVAKLDKLAMCEWCLPAEVPAKEVLVKGGKRTPLCRPHVNHHMATAFSKGRANGQV